MDLTGFYLRLFRRSFVFFFFFLIHCFSQSALDLIRRFLSLWSPCFWSAQLSSRVVSATRASEPGSIQTPECLNAEHWCFRPNSVTRTTVAPFGRNTKC